MLAGLVTTLAVIAVAFAVASILAELVAEPLRCSFDAQTPHLLLLVGAVIVQTLTVYAGQRYAQRAAQTVIGQVRDDVLGALTDPARTDMRSLVARRSRASTVLLAGLDDLGPYLSAYVPSLILAVTLTRGAQRTATVTAHPVGRWRFHSMTADVDSAADVDALAARLEAIPAKPTTVVRLGLVGSLSVGDHAGLTDLLDESSDRFAALVRWDSHDDLRVVADPADIAGLGLRGYAAEAADELVALAGSGDADAAVARDALALLGRLAGGGDR